MLLRVVLLFSPSTALVVLLPAVERRGDEHSQRHIYCSSILLCMISRNIDSSITAFCKIVTQINIC